MVVHGMVVHWRLEIYDASGDRRTYKFWNWDAATAAFREERGQPGVRSATVYAVQRRRRGEIKTWDWRD